MLLDFVKNLMLSIDQLGNVLLLGSADETISARSYRMHAKGSKGWGIARKLIDWMFWFEPDHTRQAYFAEQGRVHMPCEYREDGCEIDSEK